MRGSIAVQLRIVQGLGYEMLSGGSRSEWSSGRDCTYYIAQKMKMRELPKPGYKEPRAKMQQQIKEDAKQKGWYFLYAQRVLMTLWWQQRKQCESKWEISPNNAASISETSRMSQWSVYDDNRMWHGHLLCHRLSQWLFVLCLCSCNTWWLLCQVQFYAVLRYEMNSSRSPNKSLFEQKSVCILWLLWWGQGWFISTTR